MKITHLATALIISLSLVACGGSNNNNDSMPPSEPSITDIASDDDRFDTLVTALGITGLDETLDAEGETFTVFAPTDAAFDLLIQQIGQEAFDNLLADTEALSNILLYHVVSGTEITATQAIASAGNALTMANEGSVEISLFGSNLFLNLSQVIVTNINAGNGIIHVIDRVLQPTETATPAESITAAAVADDRFETLVSALTDTGLADDLADLTKTFTVFAPTDDAFAALGDALGELSMEALSETLLYHVVQGAKLDSAQAIAAASDSTTNQPGMLNGDNTGLSVSDAALFVNLSKVVITDIITGNGIIHVIDAVLLPPNEMGTPTQTITGIASADTDTFSILVSALVNAGLSGALADESATYTVFAPTNEAFEAIGINSADDLPTGDTLTNLLQQHVLIGSAVNSVSAYTLNGQLVDTWDGSGENISIAIVDGDSVATQRNLEVQGSTVISADIYATNGVIHVIDEVITETLPQ